MAKFAIFYSVGNKVNADRHTFDDMSDAEIMQFFSDHQYDENIDFRIYNLSDADNYRCMFWQCLSEFIEDYNNEDLDGGWWCINVSLTTKKAQEILSNPNDIEEKVYDRNGAEIMQGSKVYWHDPDPEGEPAGSTTWIVDEVYPEMVKLHDSEEGYEGREAEVLPQECEVLI